MTNVFLQRFFTTVEFLTRLRIKNTFGIPVSGLILIDTSLLHHPFVCLMIELLPLLNMNTELFL